MMKNVIRLVVLLATVACALVSAPTVATAFIHRGNGTPVSAPSSVFPITYYAGFTGWLLPSTSFPIAIWLEQDPTASAGYANSGTYNTLAKGAAAQGYNLFLGLAGAGSPNWWPENINSDNGEMAAIKAANVVGPMGLIGGAVVDYLHSSGVTNSAQSMRATASGASATANFWAYNLGDEPACTGTPAGNGPDVGQYPTAVSDIASIGADSTRMIFGNFAWQYPVSGTTCDTSYAAAINALSVSGFDMYPETNSFSARYAAGSNQFVMGTGAVANDGMDALFLQGAATSFMVSKNTSHPVWTFVDGQNNAFGASSVTGGGFNGAQGTVTMGSTALTIGGYAGVYPAKLTTFVGNGMTVGDQPTGFGGLGCIQASTTITVTGPTTATMSKTATCSSGALADVIYFTGGGDGNCQISQNLCEPIMNEYRITSSQYYSEVWNGIISGSYGIEMFQQDTTSANFSLGDPSGGAPAATAASNITFVNAELQTDAAILNRPRDACSMQGNAIPFNATTTCTTPNGVIVSTSLAAVPGLIMIISPASGGGVYMYAQSDRRSGAGATFTYTFGATYSGAVATLCRDSRTQYDPTHAKTPGATITLNGSGVFSDTIGTGGVLNDDDYNVLKYAIGRSC